MAQKGAFQDGDAAELEELIAKRILHASALSGMLGRIVAVNVWPAGAKRLQKKKVTYVHISRPTTRHPGVSATVVVPGVDAATILSWLAAAGLPGAALEESWGYAKGRFADDVAAGTVAAWATAALKAVGASPADGWRYEGEKADTD